jgi:hypothetical protein
MRFFHRDDNAVPDGPRCPTCRELLPEGSTQRCMMCGAALPDAMAERGGSADRDRAAAALDSPAARTWEVDRSK